METVNVRHHMQKNIIEKCFTNKNSESMIAAATKASKMQIVDSFFDRVKSINLDVISANDIENMIENKMNWKFDEDAVVRHIEQTFPGWNKDRVYEEVDRLEDMYEKEIEKRIEEIRKTILKNCKNIISQLKEDVRLMQDKYYG